MFKVLDFKCLKFLSIYISDKHSKIYYSYITEFSVLSDKFEIADKLNIFYLPIQEFIDIENLENLKKLFALNFEENNTKKDKKCFIHLIFNLKEIINYVNPENSFNQLLNGIGNCDNMSYFKLFIIDKITNLSLKFKGLISSNLFLFSSHKILESDFIENENLEIFEFVFNMNFSVKSYNFDKFFEKDPIKQEIYNINFNNVYDKFNIRNPNEDPDKSFNEDIDDNCSEKNYEIEFSKNMKN